MQFSGEYNHIFKSKYEIKANNYLSDYRIIDLILYNSNTTQFKVFCIILKIWLQYEIRQNT